MIEVTDSRQAIVGETPVRRALPRRDRRTVGAWCFADHMGPVTVASGDGGIGPHPHIGLQTVTWLLAGELLHRDSLGSEQLIRPGQLNLMTAGAGVAHAEENVATPERQLHGIQLWVAQPESTRHRDAAFEHHEDLPRVDLGPADATVLVGSFAGTSSPARRDTDHFGVQLTIPPGATAEAPVSPGHEHALVVLVGAIAVDGSALTVGQLGYAAPERDTIGLRADATEHAVVMLLGGTPFESEILMWWNFVARTRDEIDAAAMAWTSASDRFADTGSQLGRIPVPPRPWSSAG